MKEGLNKTIDENFNLVNIFSAKFNWLIKNSLPHIDENFNFFTSSLPHEKISILHFTQIDKKKINKFYQIEKNNYKEFSFEELLEKR